MKKAIRVTTKGLIEEIDLTSDSLTALQTAVGGWVQAIDLDATLTMWCNEEGKILDMPHNPFAQVMWNEAFGPGTDYIVGDVVFSGTPDEEGYTTGLTARAEEVIRRTVATTLKIVSPSFTMVD